MWGSYNFDFACSIARGRSGGLIFMWDPNTFIKDDIWCDDAFIIVKGHWRNTVGDCYIINIYGPQYSLAKAILWNIIGDFMHQHASKYIIFGDMNVVRNKNERSGSLFSRHDADNFNSFIDNSGLIDLPLGGQIAEALPDVHVTAIDRLWSDHNHILLHALNSTLVLLLSSFSIPGYFVILLINLSKQSYLNWRNITLEGSSYLMQYIASSKLELKEKIEAGSANDDDRDSHIKLLQEVDILDNFESFNLFQKARKVFRFRILLKLRKSCSKNHDSNVDFPLFANSFGLCALYHDSLETPVSLDEVKNADDIKVDILEYVNIFLDTCSLPHGSNSSSLSFQRLAKVIDKIVSHEKSAFIDGRQILDGPLILNIDVSSMTSNFGCASGSFPFTYLGLPIGSNMRGRHTLIKAVLDNTSIYYFLIFKVSESVLNSLNRSCGSNIGRLKAFNLALSLKVAMEVVIAQERALVHFISKRVVARVSVSGKILRYRIYTKRQKQGQIGQNRERNWKEREKIKAEGTKGLRTELKWTFPDRLDNVCAFNEVKTKSKSTPGYGIRMSMEKRTRNPIMIKWANSYPF
ncbi:RNA-directed DNA polymerase, eukaryota, reverse transcriptase zinc-binding domain protein [Tanacetum coccineum]